MVFFVVWKLGARVFRGSRIQAVQRVNGKQIGHEVKHTVATLFFGAFNALALIALYKGGYTKLTEDATEWPIYKLVAMVIGLTVFNDAWFYGWHRLLHTPRALSLGAFGAPQERRREPLLVILISRRRGFVLGAWVVPLSCSCRCTCRFSVFVQVIGLANNHQLPSWL